MMVGPIIKVFLHIGLLMMYTGEQCGAESVTVNTQQTRVRQCRLNAGPASGQH